MATFRLQDSTTTSDSNSTLHRIKHEKKDAMKPRRKRITTDQLCLLSELFQQTDTPSHEVREKLACKLDMTNREVQVWFQNRRAKVNRTKLQQKQKQHQQEQHSHDNPYSSLSSSSSSSSSSVCSTPSSPPPQYHPIYNLSSIDILISAAAYVQQWDEEQEKQKQQEPKKHKSWRPWL